jgi:hypothetical protein
MRRTETAELERYPAAFFRDSAVFSLLTRKKPPKISRGFAASLLKKCPSWNKK